MIKTRTRKEGHECNTSATQVLNGDTSATRVKNFDFDNDTSKNLFSHPYIYYMAREGLQGEEQFHFKSFLLEMRRSYAKMCLKTACTTKTELFNGKSYIKRLDTRL